jgi:hypothetical protein
MKTFKTVPTKVIDDIRCDICGQSCKVDLGNFAYMTLDAKWGYGSEHDLEQWEAEVCEECVKSEFSLVKFRKKEYLPFGG